VRLKKSLQGANVLELEARSLDEAIQILAVENKALFAFLLYCKDVRKYCRPKRVLCYPALFEIEGDDSGVHEGRDRTVGDGG
jgi:hypothetical protein